MHKQCYKDDDWQGDANQPEQSAFAETHGDLLLLAEQRLTLGKVSVHQGTNGSLASIHIRRSPWLSPASGRRRSIHEQIHPSRRLAVSA
jgi:hypothetical protein